MTFFAFKTPYDFWIDRDKFGQTPYNFAKDKESRNEFRKFMGQFPDRYDYKAAQVSALNSFKTYICFILHKGFSCKNYPPPKKKKKELEAKIIGKTIFCDLFNILCSSSWHVDDTCNTKPMQKLILVLKNLNHFFYLAKTHVYIQCIFRIVRSITGMWLIVLINCVFMQGSCIFLLDPQCIDKWYGTRKKTESSRKEKTAEKSQTGKVKSK